MKALITRTRFDLKEYTNADVKEVNTIEDILSLPRELPEGNPHAFRGWVVIPREKSHKFNDSIDADVKVEIEIYDSYRE